MHQLRSPQSGFTLVEMIVALALFSIVVTIAVGSLLMLIGSNQRLQDEQSVMTNLSFAVDSMTREIRTGTHYYCAAASDQQGASNVFNDQNDLDNIFSGTNEFDTADCRRGNNQNFPFHGISFREGGDSITGVGATRILYYFDSAAGKLYRKVGSRPAQSIVSSGIFVTNAEFFVTGSTPESVGSGNYTDQPLVTIQIEAQATVVGNPKTHALQTTVTQRTLDI